MPIMNRIIGALRGAASPGRAPGRPVGHGGGVGHPGAGRPAAGGSRGLAGILGSLLGNRRRRPHI